ncbi:hypothetical protein DB31_1178 [Hyalangium minutum]|uniref:Uncharacterized protein n=1 Tax=Hyalangium minutum TaxID=394096 RepID=A0A085WEK0_9BACT|nr:hypothetical protein DB31_1178 [Hyalangium minutum]
MNSPKFTLLAQGLEAALAGHQDEARRTFASLHERLDVDSHPEDMQYLIFSAALSRRFGDLPAGELNLYLRRFELPQIQLFNLLALRLPTVSLAGSIANEQLFGLMRGHEVVTLVDVGIGSGRQEVALLHSMAEANALPRQMTIVGVEPSADSLRGAEDALTMAAQRLGVVLRFIGIPKGAEDLSEEDWAMLGALPGARFMNAAFALHHIAERQTRQNPRDAFFEQLRRWEPRGVVLCEPNSDHHRAPIRERFHNCWRHFFLTFQLIEELDISRQEKNAMKLFFSREIEDIVGTQEEARRFERHELTELWLGRLERAGFELVDGPVRSGGDAHPAVKPRSRPGCIGLEYQGIPLVCVLTARTPERPG